MQDYQAHLEKCDGVARFFDLIFAVGLGSQAAVFLIFYIFAGGSSLPTWILFGYYCFFSLFMIGCVMRLDLIIHNMGFLDNVLYKSLFYVL
jgi:hypothetical protein